MKLTLLLIMLVFFSFGNGYSQVSLTLKFEKATLKEVLETIENQSDYVFLYKDVIVDREKRFAFEFNNAPFEEVIKSVCEIAGVDFEIRTNRQIILTEKMNLGKIVTAQQKIISGVVTDNRGISLPGVSIIVKGTSIGTVTNSNGEFTLAIPNDADFLQFSFVGMKTQDIPIEGRTTFTVILEEETIGIGEVVATAFGIKRTQRELTYSTQQVVGEDLIKVKSPDLLSSLQGKVAGVTINLTSGEVGRSPQIRIRGNRSLRDNNPLYVIDGMPVPGLTDFDPNNIESINILKGPAASALYGLKASNGVIIITTKSGEGFKGDPTITYESHYSFDNVGYLAPLQRVYAQGTNGVFNQDTWQTWGPKISEMEPYVNKFGELEEPGSYKNDEDFYETGGSLTNNLSIRNAGEFGNYILSIGDNRQTGIVPNSRFSRSSVMLGGKYNIRQNLSVSATMNFIDRYSRDQRDLTGNDTYLRGLRDTPPSYNLAGNPYADPQNPAIQVYWRGGQNNPYWVVNNNYRKINNTRVFGNVFMEYKLVPELSLNYRLGVDRNIEETEIFDNMGTAAAWRQIPPIGGRIQIDNITSTRLNSNVYMHYDKTMADFLKLDFILGNEFINYDYRTSRAAGLDFVVQGWNSISNTVNQSSANSHGSDRTVGFYGNLNLGWKDTYFINASGRNDIVSNMPRGSRSFFYPSIGASIVATEFLQSIQNILSFAKLRATYAEVGQAGPRFVNDVGFISSNPGFTFPFSGLSSYTLQGQRINPDLRPENTKSFEIGFDLRFFDNRINLDYAYYTSISKDQIFSVPLSPSTGFSSELRNSGSVESNGHEISLGLIPVSTNNFHWEFNTNFTTWKSTVVELAPGIERITFTGEIVAQAGYPFPSIVGRRQYRDPVSGEKVFNSTTGLPMLDPAITVIGNPIPDFDMSFRNSFTYKDFSLSIQVDWRSGGDYWVHSYNEGNTRGVNAITLNRDELQDPVGMKGYLQDGKLVVIGDNDIPIYHNLAYYQALGAWNISQEQLLKQTFVRLREVNLNYDLPDKLFTKSFIKSASIYLTGRNLFLIANSYYDPEVLNIEAGGEMVMGNEQSNTPPQLRSIGAGININF